MENPMKIGPCPECDTKGCYFKQIEMKAPHFVSDEVKYTLHYIECGHCSHNSGLFASQEVALEHWNEKPKEELKPCPFCQSEEAFLCSEAYNVFVICSDCKIKGPLADNENHATRKWNEREVELYPNVSCC